MKDRLTHGFIAGLLGTFAAAAITFGTQALGLNTLLWADFMGTFIMGRKPDGALEIAIFVAAQFIFLGLLGAIFSLFIPSLTSKHILFKGTFYGIVIWFLLLSLPHLLQMPSFTVIPLKTVLSHALGAALWGLATAFFLKKIDNRVTQ